MRKITSKLADAKIVNGHWNEITLLVIKHYPVVIMQPISVNVGRADRRKVKNDRLRVNNDRHRVNN